MEEQGAPATDVPTNLDEVTIDEAVDRIPLGPFHVLVFFVCGFAWMADAMEVLLLAFVGPSIRCEWDVTDVQAAMMTTIVFAGMTIGSICWGAIADRYGRKLSLILSTAVILVFGLVCAVAINFEMLLIARMVVGIGVSGVPVAFSLLMEYLPLKIRGRMGIALCVCWSLGAMAEAGLARAVMPALGWRWLLGLSTVPSFFLLLLSPFIPESARYYVASGQVNKAEAVLRRAAEMNGAAFTAHKIKVPVQEPGAASITDLFIPALRRLTATQWSMWFVAAFTYYGSVLLTTELLAADPCFYKSPDALGGDEGAPPSCAPLTARDYDQNFIATAGELPGLVLTFLIIDAIGRKRTIGMESLVMSACVALLTPCTTVVVQAVLLFIMRGMANGLFQAIYVYTGEVYPSNIRALAIGWCCSFSRLGGMTTPFVAQVLSRWSVRAALGVYSCVAFVCAILAFSLQIETAGRPMFSTVDELNGVLSRDSDRKRRSLWLELTSPESVMSVPSPVLLSVQAKRLDDVLTQVEVSNARWEAQSGHVHGGGQVNGSADIIVPAPLSGGASDAPRNGTSSTREGRQSNHTASGPVPPWMQQASVHQL